jgi:hypothetical protein
MFFLEENEEKMEVKVKTTFHNTTELMKTSCSDVYGNFRSASAFGLRKREVMSLGIV